MEIPMSRKFIVFMDQEFVYGQTTTDIVSTLLDIGKLDTSNDKEKSLYYSIMECYKRGDNTIKFEWGEDYNTIPFGRMYVKTPCYVQFSLRVIFS